MFCSLIFIVNKAHVITSVIFMIFMTGIVTFEWLSLNECSLRVLLRCRITFCWMRDDIFNGDKKDRTFLYKGLFDFE